MASTSRHAATNAIRAVLLLALSTTAMAADVALTAKGCYSSPGDLKSQGSYTYQTSGYCQGPCIKGNYAVLATSGGNTCWCGDDLPPANTKVDDSKCNVACDGWPDEDCGGKGFYSVYLTGLDNSVPTLGGTGKKSSTGMTPSSSSSVATSVTTSTQGAKTIIVTQRASSINSAKNSSGGGVNGAAVAAGVVVAVLVISAIALGAFFFVRHKRRRAAEDEYKSTQVSEFMKNGGKPPQTGYSSMSDSRLDPEFGVKRNSIGSIADNEDFSRKILRVANPDRGY